MSWIRSGFFGGNTSPLRRVSPEKAKAIESKARSNRLPQTGEKVALAVASVILASLLLGAGADLSARGWLGLTVITGVAMGLFLRFLLEFRREVLLSLSRTVTLAAFMLVSLSILRSFDSFVGLEHTDFLPLSLVAMVMALVWNRSIALETMAFAGGLFGMFLFLHGNGDSRETEGLVVSIGGALVAAMAAGYIRRRSALVRVGMVIGVTQVLIKSALLLMRPEIVDGGEELWLLFLLGVHGLVMGLLVSGLLPTIEAAFSVTTDISLLELGNTHEQPLLRKLLLEAPGTFHHSYIVGLLSEAAAEAVGANALLARVGALYHDVGKLNKPGYFAENSPEARGRHRELTPEMSLLIIAAHTRDGVELGRYYNLPEAILSFMPEHHGTSLIEYFYHAAQQLRGEEHVNEEAFRYPGPKPQRIETAIVMIADACEAIARQMPDPNLSRLGEMVHEVAFKRLMDRQFEECAMTLQDLARIEAAFVRVLQAIYHTRPTYPKGGKPNPADLSQPAEERRAVVEAAQRAAAGSKS